MPLPTGLEPRDVVAIIDANDQALAWVKDLAKVPNASINTIPSHQLIPKLIGKEVIICYGEKHPAYKSHGDNIAVFDAFIELSEFGTNLEPTGSRPINTPVSTLNDSRVISGDSDHPFSRSNIGGLWDFAGLLVAL
jgi:hypothetical protein